MSAKKEAPATGQGGLEPDENTSEDSIAQDWIEDKE